MTVATEKTGPLSRRGGREDVTGKGEIVVRLRLFGFGDRPSRVRHQTVTLPEGATLETLFAWWRRERRAMLPDVQAIIVQQPVEGGPFGAKGLGESPVIHPPAALANAIAHATGVRLTSLPITAEKILRALKDKHG